MNYYLYKLCEFKVYLKCLLGRFRVWLVCLVAGSKHIVIGGRFSSPDKTAISVENSALIANCTFTNEESDYLIRL